MQFDPLNDALVKIYNAEQAGKFDVELTPASKLLGNVLNYAVFRIHRRVLTC